MGAHTQRSHHKAYMGGKQRVIVREGTRLRRQTGEGDGGGGASDSFGRWYPFEGSSLEFRKARCELPSGSDDLEVWDGDGGWGVKIEG